MGKFNLYIISVINVEGLGLSVYWDPITTPGAENPAHSFVWGIEEDDDTLPGSLARLSKRVYFNQFSN